MIKSRARSSQSRRRERKQDELPKLDEFLTKRDYVGALTLVEFLRASKQMQNQESLEWRGYCHFHNGEHDRALACYQELQRLLESDPMYHLYIACCHYYMGEYKECLQAARKGPKCQLQARVLMHAANKLADDDTVVEMHGRLQADDLQDRLSLAALHYMRGTYEQAVDIYKNIMVEHKDFLAINVYVALAYAKLDYYDVSNEVLGVYLTQFPDSVLAINLKACNQFRKGLVKEAEEELRVVEKLGGSIADHDLARHNLVVIRNGEDALRVLPALGDVPHEARLNLCIHYIKTGAVDEAFAVVRDLEPRQAEEWILKGITHMLLGQQKNSTEHLRLAREYFQTVGTAESDCDTIPGRQAMATAFFLAGAFEDTNIYLSSIAEYMQDDQDFMWNYGISKASVGEFHEALKLLQRVTDARLRADFVYLSWLCRCLIMTGNTKAAWEVYHQMESTRDADTLLQQIANDCYRMGQFLYAANAFDILERSDPKHPDYWVAKRGACVGVVQMVLAGKESQDSIREVCQLLAQPTNQEAEQLYDVISNWAEANGLADLSM